MHHLAATLHTLGIRLQHAAATRPERGSVTIEQVLWAVAVIAIVGIVVLAVTTVASLLASRWSWRACPSIRLKPTWRG